MSDDPRLSDEATGLPPIEELGDDETLLVLAWAGGEGVVQSPMTHTVEACRFLHMRGLAVDEHGVTTWVQAHIAVPMSSAMEVAAALMGGGSIE